MKTNRIFFSILFIFLATASYAKTQWECQAGTFSGYETENCSHVKGIRYAASTRYGEAEPYVYSPGIHECTADSPFAFQLPSATEGFMMGTRYEDFPQEENCQYLSITMPKDADENSRLPVMVWIHGGAYRNGGCDSPSYDREPLVKEQNIILVGINYRLGVLGFVKGADGNFANLGLKDIILALKWVNENIEAFGGDKNNVTIFGQSAGADAVRCVMLSYGTENLYRRAILQSTPIGTYVNRQNMEKKMLEELNLLPENADREEILEAQKSIVSHVTEKGDAKYMIFAPHFGLDPLPPETQIESRLKEIAATHDIMIGSATREVAAYIGENKLLVAMDSFFLTRWIVELIIKKISCKIFINPSKKFAENYASYGGKTYHYKFTWTENKSFVGAAHTLDILPLFGPGKAEGWPAAMKLTSGEIYSRGIPMRKIWADFARSGEIQDFSVPGMLEVEEM